MNKYAKIKLVKDLCLNTEENILVRSIDDLNCEFISVRNDFSLRTFYHADSGFKKAPHYPVINKRNLYRVAPKLLQRGLWLIPADIIDPRDCLFRGAAIKTDHKIIAEIKAGPGTVRTVTRDLDIDYRIECEVNSRGFLIKKVKEFTSITDAFIKSNQFCYNGCEYYSLGEEYDEFTYNAEDISPSLIIKIDTCLFHMRHANVDDCCFEFSYYKKPIGWVPECFICWEVDFFGENSPLDRYNYLWSRYERIY